MNDEPWEQPSYPITNGEEFNHLIQMEDKTVIKRTCDEWKEKIRERLHTETGLRFVSGHERRSVRIKVVDGMPVPFANLFRDYSPELLMLINNINILKSGQRASYILQGGIGSVIDKFPRFEDQFGNPNLIYSKLVEMEELFNYVSDELSQLPFEDEFREINQDILGSYSPIYHLIEIYWMPISLLATKIVVKTEYLALIVLIHEQAHAFTHLGLDTDGQDWSTESFCASSNYIIEGLAQFYTFTLVKRLNDKYPGIQEAFTKLLKLQGEPYHEYEKWKAKSEFQDKEAIRYSMIESRRSKRNTTRDIFNQRVYDFKQKLKK